MRMMVKNGPPFNLLRASFTDNYELITDNFIISGSFTCWVIIVQPLSFYENESKLLKGNFPND